ncbi:MAG: M24 family metallopeptidase [Acidimicrobiales bacterium]
MTETPAGRGDALPPIMVAGRLDRLRSSFPRATEDNRGIGALLVTTPANIRWLTGFSGSAGLLLVTTDRALLTTDGRYRTQSAEQIRVSGAAEQVEITVGGVQAQRDALAGMVGGPTGSSVRLGLEADDVTWSAQGSWADVFSSAAVVATRGVVEGLRVIKDAAEIARMERAAAIADEGLDAVLPLLAGARFTSDADGSLTESRFAAALDHALRMAGAEDRAFETIVASGENSAKPHARPGNRRIRSGDPVVVDFGAVFDGYRSDMTRTFCVGGEPTGELARLFSVVAESQRAGVARIRPGTETGAVDRTCRQVIEEAGWGERFEHGSGHGVGLDIHEAPSVGPGSTAILAPGVVLTVEPGVYLPETGGVRIEDTLVVTEDGSRSLTQFPKEVTI